MKSNIGILIGCLVIIILIAFAILSDSSGIKYDSEKEVVVDQGPISVEKDGYGEGLFLIIGENKYQLNTMGSAKFLYRPPNESQVIANFLPESKEFKLVKVPGWFGVEKYYLVEVGEND